MYNKYNTLNSGRFNTPGTFVPARNLGGRNPGGYGDMGPPHLPPSVQFNRPLTHNLNYNNTQNSQDSFPIPPQPPSEHIESGQSDVTMDNDLESSSASDGPAKPHWMKSKLVGVKKISNKERRRRQNENLRRLLTPKNALMVLNEILPGEQLANQFKVQAAAGAGAGAQYKPGAHSFCAEICVEGVTYKGFGENKLVARNAAAEQAVRDLIIRRMSRLVADNPDAGAAGAGEAGVGEAGEGEEAVPMIQLASYALHKLFAEWEWDGHRVPQLRPHSVSESGSEGGASQAKGKAKEVPASAAAMHPCMLLAHLRPALAYRELPPQGTTPQNMIFSMAVDVDGRTYVGSASRKKEARKLAAKAACEDLFQIKFDN